MPRIFFGITAIMYLNYSLRASEIAILQLVIKNKSFVATTVLPATFLVA